MPDNEPPAELVETMAREIGANRGWNPSGKYTDIEDEIGPALRAAHDAGLIVYRDDFIETKLPGERDGEYAEVVVWIPK